MILECYATRSKEILIEESNVQHVKAPVIVCGDIHGQFLWSFWSFFKVGGEIPWQPVRVSLETSWIEGYNSVETIQLLFCYKIKYPKEIVLLRGNHESRQITQAYGFYDEVMKKYGNSAPWKYCNDAFWLLTFGSTYWETKILCIHGGLSPEIKLIDQIRTIDPQGRDSPWRYLQSNLGPFCDLMWSDPEDIENWQN